MAEKTVICQQLNKAFDGTPVVQDVSFTIESGRILVLLGPSGCGKTTTLRLIAGFEDLDSGTIEIAGQLVANGRVHIPSEKRRVGMVFQDYAIFPHLSVVDNVAFGLGRGKKAREQANLMLQMVGLLGEEQKMPHELSGGQQQRVALARALAIDPVILLLDEPFSNLDTSLRSQVRSEVRELLKANGATAVFVTHDQEEALYLGDQIAVMNEGRLEQMGTPEEVYHRPRTRFVAEFMGQTDFVSGRVIDGGVETAMGVLAQSLPLRSGTAVEVAVRPDDVRLEPADTADLLSQPGNGKVVSRRFIGVAHIYHVRLNDGSYVRSWQPHTIDLGPGTAVRATFRLDHPMTCFHDGRAYW
jgi:iron(III) transport system ATP-binding protein